MLGQPVKCPACASTFHAPKEGSPADPAAATGAELPPVRLPLPADADDLRAARVAVGIQFVAHILYAAALTAFLLLCLLVLAESATAFGPRGGIGEVLPILLVLCGSLVVLVAGLMNLVASAIAVLSPRALLARGWAIATLVLATVSFFQLASTFGWAFAMLEMPHQVAGLGGPGGWSLLTAGIIVWLVEVARLAVLAIYWRAMSRILRDARGAGLARRLAVGGPAAQMFLAVAWVLLAIAGAGSQEIMLLALVGWLALQLIVVLCGIGVVARLRRRLRAAIPD
jgi:hypothetical protein